VGKKRKAQRRHLPKIYWILLENQVTPYMVDFLKLTRERLTDVSLEFKVLAGDKGAAGTAASLHPSPFKIGFRTDLTPQNLIRKRDDLGSTALSEGLPLWRVLLIDDLGGGAIVEPGSDLVVDDAVQCIVIQIPSPVGSTANLERLFQALCVLAHKKKIPIIGVEFFPLNVPWMLAPSLVDGIITLRESSYDHLMKGLSREAQDIWLLPRHEASLLFRDSHKIPDERNVFYIPHTVPLIHEYKTILEGLAGVAGNSHLMFSVGEDQARGTYTHREIVEKVYADELARFESYSFHDINALVEITMADAVIAACANGTTAFSITYGIPTLIMDEDLEPACYGTEWLVNSREGMETAVKRIMACHRKTRGLAHILSDVLSTH
jgi:hypothetical protein